MQRVGIPATTQARPVIVATSAVIMAICAIFIILVVMFQPGNTSGIGALGGQTETFLGKNKNKTFDHKMKKLTVVSAIIFAILCIAFVIIAFIGRPQ